MGELAVTELAVAERLAGAVTAHGVAKAGLCQGSRGKAQAEEQRHEAHVAGQCPFEGGKHQHRYGFVGNARPPLQAGDEGTEQRAPDGHEQQERNQAGLRPDVERIVHVVAGILQVAELERPLAGEGAVGDQHQALVHDFLADLPGGVLLVGGEDGFEARAFEHGGEGAGLVADKEAGRHDQHHHAHGHAAGQERDGQQ